MAGVFISYRREDSPGHAGRVFDALRARLGSDLVFMDVHAIDAGVDFVDALEHAVGSCDALLAIIGPGWVGAVDDNGRRRLDESRDFVRLEIAAALRRDVRVVPVLVDHAQLPRQDELPAELEGLTRRNAVELRDSRWDVDVDELVTSLERLLTSSRHDSRVPEQRAPSSTFHRQRLWALGAVAGMFLASVGAMVGSRACAPDPVEGMRAPTAAAAVGLRPEPSTQTSSDRGNTATAGAAASAPSRARLRIDAFGLSLDTVTDTPPGVIVGGVQSGGPAENAGIAVNDVLVEVAGRSVTSFSAVADAVVHHVRTTPAGTAAVVDLVPDGERHHLPVLFDREFVTPLTLPR